MKGSTKPFKRLTPEQMDAVVPELIRLGIIQAGETEEVDLSERARSSNGEGD
ncbi:MAG TPA: hypothetical protein VHS06_11930 [Chloroflexota bacterium]|nr:hypothetical protein [Chloroflexota bacterium]